MTYSKKNTSKNKDNEIVFDDMLSLNKLAAINKYGKPHFYEQFTLEHKQRGFRVGLNKIYSLEELLNKSILIDELTWEKDSKTWITVWYQVGREKAKPKNFSIWKKGTDFYSLSS